jgi:hypothetical protein
MFGFLRRAVKREAEKKWDNRNGCSSHGIVIDLAQRAALICLSTLVTLPVRAQRTETGGPTPEAIQPVTLERSATFEVRSTSGTLRKPYNKVSNSLVR